MKEILIAAAGSGKTKHIVDSLLSNDDGKKQVVLTYTISNTENIRSRIWSQLNYIPGDIHVMPWFTFVLRHMVKPYSNLVTSTVIKGVQLVSSISGVKYYMNTPRGKIPVCYKEDGEFDQHFFNSQGSVYSDKLAKLGCKINTITGGKVIARLTELFDHIYIDEVQDLACEDLTVLKLLLESSIDLTIVGDPRQVTYQTHHGRKYKKYGEGGFDRFVNDHCSKYVDALDFDTLNKSYRCVEGICLIATKLFPDLKAMESLNEDKTEHDGVFSIDPKDVNQYLSRYNPVQLRDNIKTEVDESYEKLNIGISKGLTFDRVIIFPTKPMLAWFRNNEANLKFKSRCKLYVAITRAKYSVGIVSKNHDLLEIPRWIK